jgi:outer membrane biosynthesis protein TonB
VQMGGTPQPAEAYSRCSQPASAIPPPPPEPPEPVEPPAPPVPVPSVNGDPPQEIAKTSPRTPTTKRVEIFMVDKALQEKDRPAIAASDGVSRLSTTTSVSWTWAVQRIAVQRRDAAELVSRLSPSARAAALSACNGWFDGD